MADPDGMTAGTLTASMFYPTRDFPGIAGGGGGGFLGIGLVTALFDMIAGALPRLRAAERSNERERTDTIDVTLVRELPQRNKEPVIFPVNPADFCPIGLVPTFYPGTYNGSFIRWHDSSINIVVFEWDQNPNGSDGSHYHIRASGDTHFYPGMIVPEPYASLYFPRD